MNDAPLTDEEVRNVFYSLKANKSPGYHDISFNVINNVSEETKISRIMAVYEV